MNKFLIILAALAAPLWGTAQNIFAFRSVSDLNRPEVTWYTLDKTVKPGFQVFRAPVGSAAFARILTMERNSSGHDTLFFHMTDTTLTAKGMYQYYIKAASAKDTALLSEVMYGHNLGSVPKPQVVSFTATSVPGRKALALDWKLNYSFTAKALALFRSRHYDKGFELVAVLPADTTHYEDVVQVSNEPYFYFIQVRDFFGYQLPSVVIHGICTYAVKAYPPQNFTAATEREGVTLSWKAVGSNITGYRVYKSIGQPGTFTQAGPEIKVSLRPGGKADSLVRYTDTAVHAPGQLTAKYYAVTVSDGYLESNHTDTLSVMLPWNIAVAPPKEVEYTTDSSGGIRLFWTAAAAGSGVRGYNVYRSSRGAAPKKLNTGVIPADENTFLDPSPGFGKIDYSVETLSPILKASAMRTTVTVNRPVQGFHLVLTAEQVQGGIQITWLDPAVAGLETIYIYRKAGDGDSEMRGMAKPSKQSWTDTSVTAGGTYIYTAVAEFKDGTRFLVNDGVLVAAR